MFIEDIVVYPKTKVEHVEQMWILLDMWIGGKLG